MKMINPIPKKNFPVFTIASAITPILLAALSYPIWSHHLRDSDPTGKAGIFVVVALINLVFVSLAAGSILGLILAAIGYIKRERWVFIRGFTLIMNALLVVSGIYTVSSLPREEPQAEQPVDSNPH